MTAHTLEKLARAMGPAFDEERLHAGLLLSFAQAAYGAVRAGSSPSPLYRLGFDDETNHVAFEETGGSSHVPRAAWSDLSDLDVLLICNLRDIPVLLEGETGVGKTFVSQAYLRSILPAASSVALRLSGSTFLNNVFQPFLEGRIEQGMPVTRIKQSAVDGIAALFIDEINRGDPQSILQLLDGEVYNAGVFTRLGPPIPRLAADGALAASERRKKLLVVSAQNPAATTEARFTGTIELDAAVDNRLLKVSFGNAARSVGSTLWLTEEPREPFEGFVRQLSGLAADHLGVEPSALARLPEDWLGVYAWLTDSTRTDKPVLYSALELTDLLTTVLGGDLPATNAYELAVIEDWCARLGAKVPLDEAVKATESVQRIHQLVATFKVPVIFRDIVQVKKLADVLATLQNLRDALSAPTPVTAYLGLERCVSVREVALAAALLARSKQWARSPSPTPLVNEVVAQYAAVCERYLKDVGYMPTKFVRGDPNVGIKRLALARAAREALKQRSGGALVQSIVREAARLGKYLSATGEVANLLVSKTVADLLTLAGFVAHDEAAVSEALAGLGPTAGDGDVVRELARLYVERRRTHAPVLPDIFQHRVQRTLGV